MNIKKAQTDEDIGSCFAVMKELRHDLDENQFVEKVRELQKFGYMLVFVEVLDEVVSVAGFRLGESLAWKRYLYIDDLVTLSEERSKGYGRALLQWLAMFAHENGCNAFHLDSGVERKDAHMFYEREGMNMRAYHFVKYINT